MLDTIVYIPTILAYAFITLLIVILGFIVIYISHKIYISVYDNLPVPDMRSSTYSMDKMENITGAKNAILQISKHASMNLRTSKTALRIIVTLEPCYLAYVVFDTSKPFKKYSFTTISTEAIAPPTATTQTLSNTPIDLCYFPSHDLLRSKAGSTQQEQHNKLVKYFDRLSDIPRGKVMEVCPNVHSKLTLSLLSSVFDSVIRNAVLARRPSLTMPQLPVYNHIEEKSQSVFNTKLNGFQSHLRDIR